MSCHDPPRKKEIADEHLVCQSAGRAEEGQKKKMGLFCVRKDALTLSNGLATKRSSQLFTRLGRQSWARLQVRPGGRSPLQKNGSSIRIMNGGIKRVCLGIDRRKARVQAWSKHAKAPFARVKRSRWHSERRCNRSARRNSRGGTCHNLQKTKKNLPSETLLLKRENTLSRQNTIGSSLGGEKE